jgi:hypothetical protein
MSLKLIQPFSDKRSYKEAEAYIKSAGNFSHSGATNDEE